MRHYRYLYTVRPHRCAELFWTRALTPERSTLLFLECCYSRDVSSVLQGMEFLTSNTCFRGSVFPGSDVTWMQWGRAKGSGQGLPCTFGAQTLMWLQAQPEGRPSMCWGSVMGCRESSRQANLALGSSWGFCRRDVGLRAGSHPCYSTHSWWLSSP